MTVNKVVYYYGNSKAIWYKERDDLEIEFF